MPETIATCYSSVNSNLRVPAYSRLLFNAVVDNKEIRRANMLMLVEQFGSLRKLADEIGTDSTYLSNIKNRVNDRGMGDEIARRFEEKLGKSRGWMDVLQAPLDVEDKELPFGGGQIPVVGYVMGGDRGYYDEQGHATGHGEGYVTYPTKDRNTYALRVRGDSMRPRIKPGEYIVVMPNHPVKPGDEVVVRVKDGRVMVKRLGPTAGGIVELQSINESDHPPITVEELEIEKIHYVGGIAKDYLYRTAM